MAIVSSSKRVLQQDWKKEGIPFYRAREIGTLSEKGSVENELFISHEHFSNLPADTIPQTGDVMLTAVGTLGKAYIVKVNDHFYFKDASVLRLRPSGAVSSDFLKLYFDSLLSKKQIISNTAGTTVGTITIEKCSNYIFPLPPFREQCEIVARISDVKPYIRTYDALHAKQEKLNISLNGDIRKSLLQEAIQGKLVLQLPEEGTAQDLLVQIRAEKERLVREGKLKPSALAAPSIERRGNSYYENGRCIDDEIPFDIPDSWAWVRLGSISNYGFSQKIQPDFIEADTWILDLEDMEKGSGHILKRKKMKEVGCQSDKSVFSAGNVLYSKLRPYLNKVAVADESGVCTSEIVPILFYGNIVPQYARYCLMSEYFLSYAVRKSYGVKMPRLGTEDARAALFPLPSVKEQRRIVAAIDGFLSLLKP